MRGLGVRGLCSLMQVRSPTISPLVRLKPKTPGLRGTVLLDKSALSKVKPHRALTEPMRRHGGRNHHGRITVRFRGGENKRRYRIIDFKRQLDLPAVVQTVEYDPNRNAYIALVEHQVPEGETLPDELRYAYFLAARDIVPGQTLYTSRSEDIPEIKPGNCMRLKYIPLGTLVHNVELEPGKGGQIARSAGNKCQVLNRDPKIGYVLLGMCSKERRWVHEDCMGTIGVVSNPNWKHRKLGKAGRRRWAGFRPHVRGMAMNPCDHPHGGGEGRSKGNRPSSSPWGWTCKGRRTRSPRKKDWRIDKRRYQVTRR